MKRVLVVVLAAFACWGCARFCHHQTKGFCIGKLQHNTSCIAHPHPEALELRDQTFQYFGRGLQSFSFLSEDQTTVLKLFNNRYQRRLSWLQWIPPIGPLKSMKEKKITYNQNKWALTFESYALAFHTLKEETGLLFFHPNACGQCPTVTLVDPLGIAHKVNLSNHAFVLQKKASLAYPYLESCVNEPEQAREAIFSLVHLIKKKMDLGIADRDPLIRTNIGFLNGRAMQIDIGPLSLDPTLKQADRQQQEIPKITLSLKHWLENHHPELLCYLNEALQTL